MSLIAETKPKVTARVRASSKKKVAPRTKAAIKAIEAADQGKPARKPKKLPPPEMRDIYGPKQVDAVVSDLIACYISQWTGNYDPKKSKAKNLAKAAEAMVQCATRIGTHTAKLQNSRIHVLDVPPFVAEGEDGRNLPLSYMGGVDGNQRVGYAMLHPIRFEGENEPRCVFERIRDRGDLSDPLVTALLKPATPLVRTMLLRAVLRQDYQELDGLVTDNFPMIYVPDENFEDTTLTPLQAKSFFLTLSDIRWMQPAEGEEEGFVRPLRHSEVIEHTLVAKASNIGFKSGERTRVMTFLPKVSDQLSAATYRYMSDGPFPRLRDDRLPDLMLRATELFETTQGPNAYSNTHIRKGIVNIVRMMLSIAQEHLDCVLALAEDEFGWSPERPPSAEDLLMAYRTPARGDDIRKRVRNFLASETFLVALKRA